MESETTDSLACNAWDVRRETGPAGGRTYTSNLTAILWAAYSPTPQNWRDSKLHTITRVINIRYGSDGESQIDRVRNEQSSTCDIDTVQPVTDVRSMTEVRITYYC